MIDKLESDYFIASCDNCSDEFAEESFMECVDRMKNDGWQIKKDKNDEWVHLCPDCKDQNKTLNL